jgi:hypothetical protein
VLELTARAGDTVTLSATGSSDPDGQRIAMSWFVYREAGTYEGDVKLSSAAGDRTTFVAPAVKRPSTVHVILQVQDDGTPQLTSYRRAVVTVTP